MEVSFAVLDASEGMEQQTNKQDHVTSTERIDRANAETTPLDPCLNYPPDQWFVFLGVRVTFLSSIRIKTNFKSFIYYLNQNDCIGVHHLQSKCTCTWSPSPFQLKGALSVHTFISKNQQISNVIHRLYHTHNLSAFQTVFDLIFRAFSLECCRRKRRLETIYKAHLL